MRKIFLFSLFIAVLFSLNGVYFATPSSMSGCGFSFDENGSFYLYPQASIYPSVKLMVNNRFLIKEFTEYGIEYSSTVKNIHYGVGLWFTGDNIYTDIQPVFALSYFYNNIILGLGVKIRYISINYNNYYNIPFYLSLSTNNLGIIGGYDNGGLFGVYFYNNGYPFGYGVNALYMNGFISYGIGGKFALSDKMFIYSGICSMPMYISVGIEFDYTPNSALCLGYAVESIGPVFSIEWIYHRL